MTAKRGTIRLIGVLLILGLLLGGAPVRTTVGQDPAPPGDGPWVVRAYYTDKDMLAGLTAWTEPWDIDLDAQYVVLDVDRAGYERLLAAGFRLEVDPALTAQLTAPRLPLQGQVQGIPGYPCYRTVEETYADAAALAAAHPDLAAWIDAGDSWAKTQDPGAGYDMMVLRLTNAAVPGPKPALFVMAAVHAREYTPAELTTRFAEYLLAGYGTDADATWLLDHHEIHLMLQANPDGRKIAGTGVYWRKNVDDDDGCTDPDRWGVDLNRNFSFRWHGCGDDSCSSSNPCYSTYRGPGPASEPEVSAIEAYVRANFPDQRPDDPLVPAPDDASGVFLDIHSAGGWLLWPWGYGGETANGTAFQTLGRKLAYYNGYYPAVGSDLYPTDGVTFDFAYGKLGLAGLAFELGTAFFQGCDAFENTILPDNLPALLYAAKVARSPYLTPAGPDVLAPAVAPPAAIAGRPVLLTATADDGGYSERNGVEPSQVISAAVYTLDLPPWDASAVAYPLAAADGAFDAQVEALQASVDTAGLAPGRHTVFLQAQDADGNWGAVSAVFVEVRTGSVVFLPLVVKTPAW